MINSYPVLTGIGIIFLDTVITIISLIVAMYIRGELGLSAHMRWQYYFNLMLLIIIVWRGISEYQSAYAGKAYTSLRYSGKFSSLKREIILVLQTVLIGCPLVYIISHFISYFTLWEHPKSLITIFAFVNFTFLSVEKVVIYKMLGYFSTKNKNKKKVLVLGTGEVARNFISSLKEQELNIIGLVDNEVPEKGKKLFGYNVLGSYRDLSDILHTHYIDELIVALPARYLGEVEEIVSICDKEGVPMRIVSPFFKNIISNSRAEMIHGVPNIILTPVERNDLEMAVKRLIDITVSLSLLVLLSPLFLLIAVFVKLDSSGPVFYKWKILGLNKKPLTSYKFRSMVQDADEQKNRLFNMNEMKGAAFKMKDDPRVTRVGAFMRKYSLDELPQLWSVLKGDLSLVGPRPPLQTEVEQYEGWHRRKLSVKPGITCLWQISGRNQIADFDEWMRLDLKYIDEWTLWLDFKIFIKTIFVVIKGTGL